MRTHVHPPGRNGHIAQDADRTLLMTAENPPGAAAVDRDLALLAGAT